MRRADFILTARALPRTRTASILSLAKSLARSAFRLRKRKGENAKRFQMIYLACAKYDIRFAYDVMIYFATRNIKEKSGRNSRFFRFCFINAFCTQKATLICGKAATSLKKAGIAHSLASSRRRSTLFRAEPSGSRKNFAEFLRLMFAPDLTLSDSRRMFGMC